MKGTAVIGDPGDDGCAAHSFNGRSCVLLIGLAIFLQGHFRGLALNQPMAIKH